MKIIQRNTVETHGHASEQSVETYGRTSSKSETHGHASLQNAGLL